MDIGLLILRLFVGGLFFAHGTQKLFGWFGGYGLEGTGGFFESLRLRPGRLMAAVAGLSEAGGGLLLAAGFLTPLGAAAIIGVMVVAIFTAKLSQGLFGGYEIDLLYAVAAAAVAFAGPGAYSLDAALGWDLSGATWGLGAVALALVTGVLTLGMRRTQPEATHALEQDSRAA